MTDILYYVWVPGRGEPRQPIMNYGEAVNEALRLADKEKLEALVIQVRGKAVPPEKPIARWIPSKGETIRAPKKLGIDEDMF